MIILSRTLQCMNNNRTLSRIWMIKAIEEKRRKKELLIEVMFAQSASLFFFVFLLLNSSVVNYLP